MRRFVTSLVVAVAALGVIGFAGPATAASSRHCTFPASIPLPNLPQQPGGWRPEGLTIGRGTSFYVGSLADGAVFRGDLCTGRGGVLVAGTPGTAKTGLKVDRWNRLWAAGAGGGDARVYDAATGASLAHFRFTDQTATFINDLVVTQRAVYFTDSQQPVLYVVPLGRHGALPGQAAVRALPLSGPAAEKPGIDYQKKKRRPHDGHGARLEDLVNIACSARRRCRADRGCLVPGERTGPPRTIAVIPEIQKPACLLSILVPISIRSVSRTSPA